ncbi:7TM protein involved in diverse intracellular signaling [Mongoliibacter ruber]|uniref:7TM protein involved in diverse intracellular signaling n=1 Tax=Mongoliibacter ruber TaxID=1750599 RepID=A0A2T0WGD8_9BACT|nr:7TM protein involved in diverse intracellular signaling [Mongoliibacter ruber]
MNIFLIRNIFLVFTIQMYCIFPLFSAESLFTVSEPITLSNEKEQYYITNQVEYLEDPTGKLSIDNILTESIQRGFQKSDNPYTDFDNVDAVLWVRVRIKNDRSVQNEAWIFESWGFDIEKVTFYIPERDGVFYENEAGYGLPFDTRAFPHKNLNQLINVRPGESKTFYLRVHRNYLMGFSFHVRKHDQFISHATNEYFFLGIYYGVLSIVLFFTIYLLMKQREPIYAYFAFFLFSCIWYSLGRDGLGFQYLWPNIPEVNLLTKRILTQLLLVVSALLFANHFVQKLAKDLWVKCSTWSAIVLIILLTINQELGMKINDQLVLVLITLVLLVPIILMVRALIRINQISWAHSFALVCMLIVILQSYASEANFDLFDNAIVNWYFANPVIFAEVIFFSISIFNQIGYLQKKGLEADRDLNIVLREKNRLQDELNNKLKKRVKKRTEKINDLANELSLKNRQLLTANNKLRQLNEQVISENKTLSLSNIELREGLEKTTQAMVLMKGFDFGEFQKIFPDRDACCKFLSELKWANGFHCRKCGYNKATSTKAFGRRCRNCNYNESATSNTLFHKIKFPIEKAFYMLYLSNRKDVSLTLNELSEIIELRRETCWAFKNKIEASKEKIDFNGELNGWETLALVDLESDKEI